MKKLFKRFWCCLLTGRHKPVVVEISGPAYILCDLCGAEKKSIRWTYWA